MSAALLLRLVPMLVPAIGVAPSAPARLVRTASGPRSMLPLLSLLHRSERAHGHAHDGQLCEALCLAPMAASQEALFGADAGSSSWIGSFWAGTLPSQLACPSGAACLVPRPDSASWAVAISLLMRTAQASSGSQGTSALGPASSGLSAITVVPVFIKTGLATTPLAASGGKMRVRLYQGALGMAGGPTWGQLAPYVPSGFVPSVRPGVGPRAAAPGAELWLRCVAPVPLVFLSGGVEGRSGTC